MGTFFPTGLERLKSVSATFVPWAWGLNGIASVLAPILSIGLAITFGNTFLLVIALPLYLARGRPASPRSAGAACGSATRGAQRSGARPRPSSPVRPVPSCLW